jgi:hypothetical protein
MIGREPSGLTELAIRLGQIHFDGQGSFFGYVLVDWPLGAEMVISCSLLVPSPLWNQRGSILD